jgi:hypothetical protein
MHQCIRQPHRRFAMPAFASTRWRFVSMIASSPERVVA